MASLITTDIIRYQHPETRVSLRSHVLHPQSDITIICIIGSSRESVTSVVEDHLLETISSTWWKHGEEDSDFSFVTEKYNHFLTNLANADEETVKIILAVERDGHLMVSSIGESEVILQEPDAIATNIHEDTHGHHRFELISSGDIPPNSSVFIISKGLEGILWDSFYSDCALTESTTFTEMTKEILAREVQDTVHLVRIRRSQSVPTKGKSRLIKNESFDQAWQKITKIFNKISHSNKFREFKESSLWFFEEKQSILLTVFFITWIVIFFLLVSYLISALFSITSSQTKDTKNQIIEANTLIESSQKLVSNPAAFDKIIKDAEKILAELDAKQLYTKDVQELRNKIEAMKQEIYDIKSVDLTRKTSLVPLDTLGANIPLNIYEYEKKLLIIWTQWAVTDYAIGDTTPKIKPYPSGEVARDSTLLEDGNFYILTESNRIIASRKSAEISYINVNGQDWWEKADGINTFNGNIYLWTKKDGQIYKHKPWLNGFSAKSSVFSAPNPEILDVGIDGWFYIIKNDQKIIRLVGSNGTQTWILLNKIPGEYTIGKNLNSTKIIVRSELNYIYILDGNRVWVFLPDSKRFQDVKSWTYIAQIELSTPEEIRDIAVARDGLIYVLTAKGVYDLVFEFVDNNILVRP